MPRLPTLLAFLLTTLPLAAADKPVPTKDAAGKFTVPKGFNVTLFAGEPDIVQPIAFTFDDRGRMWLVECLSYPQWRADGKGSDRVVILEDTDGDGVHDKKTVVIDNGVNLSGIEVGFGGVWLCSTPNLIFVPIKDDKPSGPLVVHLDGWNLKDAKHNVFNGLAWGPDGWLYGCNGIQTKSHVGAPGTPQDKRTFFDCGVWRYHPTRKVFDVVAVGMTNPWGLDWDDNGEMFATNCVIDHLWHVVPGGHYQRMYGQDANPYAFGHMSSAVDYKHWGSGHWTEARADKATGAIKKEHDTAGGGHAHSGAAVYLGDQFPAEYRNTLFTCNIHGSRLNSDGLERTPAGMKGVRRPDFAFANDPWFRGIAVKQGPEGSLYVCDWSDTGECHNYEVADKTNGRVFRISYGTPKPWRGDVSKMTAEQLRDAVTSDNEWLSRKARRVLQERTAAGENLARLFEGRPFPLGDDRKMLRTLWGQLAVGGIGPSHIQNGLGQIPSSRRWLMQFGLPHPEYAVYTRRAILADSRTDPLCRRDQSLVLRYFPTEEQFALARKLFSHPEDNADDKLTQLFWFGIQPAVLAHPAEALKLVNSIAIRRVRTNVVRLLLSLPNSDPTKQLDNIFPVLMAADTDDKRQDILGGILQAFEERKRVTPPAAWQAVYPKLAAADNPGVRDLAETLALAFGDERAIAALKARLTDPTAAAAARRRAVERLVAKKVPGLAAVLQGLLADPAVRPAAIRGLAAFADDGTPAVLLKSYPALPAEEKADAVQTLASRPAFALALLDAVERGAVPKADVNTFTARQLLALNDKAVSAKLAAVWGTVRPASATRVEQTAKLKALLTPATLAKADLGNGRRLYAANCAACHKLFDDGGNVGPELTGAQRASLDYVLENVLDPSAVVPGDYRLTTFALIDGRTVAGIVKKETPQTLTVRTLNEEVVIPVADIEARKQTQLSIMPDGLFDKLTAAEVRDLVGYLASPRQVPGPR